MPENHKQIIPIVSVIVIVLAVFGWQFIRMENIDRKTDLNQANISAISENISKDIGKINGKIDTMTETLRWLEKEATLFQKKNGGTLNMEKFIESLLTTK